MTPGLTDYFLGHLVLWILIPSRQLIVHVRAIPCRVDFKWTALGSLAGDYVPLSGPTVDTAGVSASR
jgi:hypothetical protein